MRDHEQLARRSRDRLCLRRVEGGLEPGELGFRRGEDDLVLGGELVVDRRLRHTDRVGDHLERRPADAVVGEQRECGGDDPGLRGGVRLRGAHGASR